MLKCLEQEIYVLGHIILFHRKTALTVEGDCLSTDNEWRMDDTNGLLIITFHLWSSTF